MPRRHRAWAKRLLVPALVLLLTSCTRFGFDANGPVSRDAWPSDTQIVAKDAGAEDGDGTEASIDDNPPHITMLTLASDTTTVAENHTFSWHAHDGSGSGLAVVQPYQVEVFGRPNCQGTVVAMLRQQTSSYEHAGILAYGVVSIRVTAFDAAGNASEPVCSANVHRYPSHGIAVGKQLSCASRDGTVNCWGNSEGAYGAESPGDGANETYRYLPTPLPALERDIHHAAIGNAYACAIRQGQLLCWGTNRSGALGDGTTIGRSQPEQVFGASSGVTHVATSTSSLTQLTTCYVQNGTAKCMGHNGDGQLGDGTTQSSAVPVDVVGLGSGVTDIAIGHGIACAAHDGAAKCWGNEYSNPSGAGSAVPQQIPGLESGVTAVVAGA